jgi:hypothetical protein
VVVTFGGDDGCPGRPVYGQWSPQALAWAGEGCGRPWMAAAHGPSTHGLPAITGGAQVWQTGAPVWRSRGVGDSRSEWYALCVSE